MHKTGDEGETHDARTNVHSSYPFDPTEVRKHLDYPLSEALFLEIATSDFSLFPALLKYVSKCIFPAQDTKKKKKTGACEDDEIDPKNNSSKKTLKFPTRISEGSRPSQSISVAQQGRTSLGTDWFDDFMVGKLKKNLRLPPKDFTGTGRKKKCEPRVNLPKVDLGLGWHYFAVQFTKKDMKINDEEEALSKEEQDDEEGQADAFKQSRSNNSNGAPPSEKKDNQDEDLSVSVPLALLHQRIGKPNAENMAKPFFSSMVLFCRRDWLKDVKWVTTEDVSRNAKGADKSDDPQVDAYRLHFPLLHVCRRALKNNMEIRENEVSIYRFNCKYGTWELNGRRWARSLDSVVVDKKMKTKLLQDADWFSKDTTRQFYAEHGIPYHRCYLFHGPPGAGKTSFIFAMAGHLERHLCFLQVTAALTDDAFRNSMQSLPGSCLLVLEDVDSLFTNHRETKVHTSSLSFAGFLNALDGFGAAENVMVFLTTNHAERLDAAVLRPGRVDLQMEFKAPDRQVAETYFKTFYPITESDKLPGSPQHGNKDSGDIIKPDTKESLLPAGGNGTKKRKIENSTAMDVDKLKTDGEIDSSTTVGTDEGSVPECTASEIQAAAETFGKAVGERLKNASGSTRVSMADLQHFFLECHRLGKNATGAAEYVKDYKFPSSFNTNSNGYYM